MMKVSRKYSPSPRLLKMIKFLFPGLQCFSEAICPGLDILSIPDAFCGKFEIFIKNFNHIGLDCEYSNFKPFFPF